MNPIEQQFFNDLEKKLWTAADKLRSNLDAAVYKHVVLGLIFLKYVSDAFEELRSVGWLIDNAMEAIERENEKKLKNVLNKDFARTQIDSHKLADLIAHFSDTDFNRRDYNGQPLGLKSKDILGHVYEYFLGQFALAAYSSPG